MASLKDLKNRIKSVKNTQKITKAMKMVAAAKLRRAREQAENARPYAERMERMLNSLAASMVKDGQGGPALMTGKGRDDRHLIVVATSDRGLCGAFNSSIVRATRRKIAELESQGKQVSVLYVGRKGYDMLRVETLKITAGKIFDISKRRISYEDAENIALRLMSDYEQDKFDVCHIVYNRFRSAISQIPTFQQLIPLPAESAKADEQEAVASAALPVLYEYEPNEESILNDLLPRNVTVQLFKALLENAASEQGARMTAMDNASRNAGEMIRKLTLVYNRTRQAAITKELIEIISGAEAL
jgi:F-type H+-transporting ATPase subunit gamma